MKCPYCGESASRVVDSRPGKNEYGVRRRRECQVCCRRFVTFERVENVPVMIVKKDNRREEFNREKILNGVKKACEKRAISVDQMEEIAAAVERDLRERNEKEVHSRDVGERVMAALHKLDDVAYVRFASVYREFKDVDDFIQELKSLLPRKYKNAGKLAVPEKSNE